MDINRVGVVGAGVMGSGIAQTCAQAGYKVLISDLSNELLEKALSNIDKDLTLRISKGKLSQRDRDSILMNIQQTTKISDFRNCDLIIEAVVENLDTKKKVFAELDAICPDQAILASNTSTMSIIAIATSTTRPNRVIGMHFFNPAPAMKLLEIIKTIATTDDTLEIVREFGNSIGKKVVVAPDIPGFLVNRLMSPFSINAIRTLEAGIASKEDIDTAIKLATSMQLGPFEVLDIVGLDVFLNSVEYLYKEYHDPQFNPPILLKNMVIAGWLGRKTGKGFYNYTNEDSKNVER